MNVLWVLLLVGLRTGDLRHLRSARDAQPGASQEGQRAMEASAAETKALQDGTSRDRVEHGKVPDPKRVARGAKDGTFGNGDPHPPGVPGLPPRRHDDPSGYFTTPRIARDASAPPGNSSGRGKGLLNPLFPVTDASCWAYAVMLLALVLFAAGIVGNLALMCIVWHNVYLKSTWNCVLAGLALCDFLVLFFCLPVVVFHELTLKRLLGDLSCRLVPYLEVTSLGVATFSLCALSIDRFHAATGPGPLQTPKVEPCPSILSRLSVIWLGSLVLAAPELLLWQLQQETVSLPAPSFDLQRGLSGGPLMAAFRARTDKLTVDVCVREPAAALPDGIFSLVLTYQQARAWWLFGCFVCLPLLFTLACDLVTRQASAHRLPPGGKVPGRCSSSSSSSSSSSTKKKQRDQEQRRRSTVMALTILYVGCNLPESVCNIILTYISAHAAAALPPLALPALALIGQFLLFLRCAASPLLLLVLCRSLGQAFMDCCCCCCEDCLPDGGSSSCSASTAATSSPSSPTSLTPSCLAPPTKEEAKSDGRVKDSSVGLETSC